MTFGDSVQPSPAVLSILQQTSAPRLVVLVAQAGQLDSKLETEAKLQGWKIAYTVDTSPANLRAAGAKALLATAPDLRNVVFLAGQVRLEPGYIEACDSVFENQPNVAILSSWMRYENLDSRGSVDRSWLSLGADDSDNFPDCIAVRSDVLPSWTEACVAEGNLATVVYPGVLATVSLPAHAHKKGLAREKRYSVMAGVQFGSSGRALTSFIAAPLRDKIRFVTLGIKQPGRTLRWIAAQARSAAGRFLEARGEHVR